VDFRCSAKALKDIIDAARHAVPASPALAVFGGVQLEATDGTVTATGSDGETTIAAKTSCQTTTPGVSVLPVKPLSTFLSTIDQTAQLHVTLQDGEVSVKAGKLAPYKFRTTGTRFPQILHPKGEERAADLSRLADALAVVRQAAAKDHHGVQIVSNSSGLHLRTTDHYRLHSVSIAEASFGEFSGVVALPVLERIAHHAPTSVVCDDRGRAVRFSSENIAISARLLQVPFPNVDAVLQTVCPVKTTVDVPSARSALARLGAVADGAAVVVSGDSDGLHFDVANADVGSGSEVLEGGSAELRFASDRQYLLDALVAHQADAVELGYSGQHAPVILQSKSPFTATTIVMPMRV
jgi:DNA polymerase III sliding clamp (beta) subunit (PCNA family)